MGCAGNMLWFSIEVAGDTLRWLGGKPSLSGRGGHLGNFDRFRSSANGPCKLEKIMDLRNLNEWTA